MKAVVYHRYGSPDVLRLADVDAPSPGPDQVLVRVHSAAVNPADWRLLRADPFLVRVMGMGLFSPKRPILGADVAGVVEAVGEGVTSFSPGDRVFGGSMEDGSGTFAEYVTVPERALARIPEGVGFDAAAAVPLAALTALLAVRDVGRVTSGQRVLVQGASGGVGTFAVQMAKVYGAEVTAVTSAKNRSLVEDLGADRVVDYTLGDWTLDERYQYDVIVAVCGYQPMTSYARRLAPRGTFVGVGGDNAQLYEGLVLGPLLSLFSQKRFVMMSKLPSREDLELVASWMAAGELRSVIDRAYSLAEVPDAIRYVEAGHTRGKVVIRVAA